MSYGLTTRFQDIEVSTAYRFMLNCSRLAGAANVPTDLTINGNDGVLSGGMADADLWANAGYFSTIDGTDEAIEMPLAAHAYNMNAGQSLIFSFVINAAVLAVSNGIFGSYAFGALAGFRGVSFSGSGSLRPSISDGVNPEVILTDLIGLNDGTDHTATIMIDGTTKLAYSFIDGVLIGSSADLSAVTGSTVAAGAFHFGNDTDTGAGDSYAAKWREIHYLVLNDALPSNIANIAQLLHTRRGVPLSVKEVGL